MVQGLERSSSVSGYSVNVTTHHTMFQVEGLRVRVDSPQPAVLANDDRVVVVGMQKNGQLHALACKGVDSGWVLQQRSDKAVRVAIYVFMAILVVMSPLGLFLPLLIVLFFLYVLKKMKDQRVLIERANQLLHNEYAHTPPPPPRGF